jgi:integrase
MSMNAEKVVKLQTENNVVSMYTNEVYEDIKAFLGEITIHSEKTKVAYEKNIRQFFEIMCSKKIEHLSKDDLVFKRNDILKFRKILVDKGYANGSINQKLSSIKSLYNNLESNEYKLNTSIFNIKRLKNNPNSYGSLSQTEAERFAEMALTERNLKNEKRLLILFAIRTSFRLDEILNVTWNDFEYVNGVYTVKTIGKGQKKNKTAISQKLYNELLMIKNEKSKKVFQMDEKTINRTMDRLRKKLGISQERNIVFHSFRGVAIDWELETTGDIRKAAQQGNHSSIETTYRHYINKSKDYTQVPGVRMEEEIDLSFLDGLTVEDFKEYIRQGNYKLQMDIKNYFDK